MSGGNLPALQRTVLDLVEEYDQKASSIAQAIADYDAAHDRIGMAATVQGSFVAPVGSKSYLSERELQKNLLASGWKAIYNRLEIASIASAKDKQLFDRTLADPPPLTFDNAKATFRDYLERPRFHILKGLAEVFADLDPAYKSHSKVRIGVKGLPPLVPTDIVEGREARVHRMPPGPDRWKERSRFFDGIANAMADQWGPLLNERLAA